MADQEILEGFNGSDASVGVTGALRVAPVGSPYVVGVGKYNPEVQKNLGYVSDDGVEEGRDEDKQEWIPWQENTPIRSDITKSVVTLKFVLWQSNQLTTGFYYGVKPEDVTENEDGSFQFDEGGKPDLDYYQVYLDVLDKGRIRRTILANAQVSERGSVVYKTDEMVGYEVTVTAYPGPQGWSVRRIFFGYAGFGEDAAPSPSVYTVDPTAATFTLSVGGQTTPSLDDEATAAEVQSALTALSTVGAGKATVTRNGTTGAYTYTVVLASDVVGTLTATGATVE
ncbi:major tail subunit [Gordonia phage Ghobes]|uniref:Major tail subunit n=1 Tax=Gordonia phage Ghobes TaxID=1887647 RepID=A0A1B3B037_9CAUD|nr:major tail protein [Gordonia phage Ghobes]AOE44364.1 major tail subunit [Gordonia phage Ghobes]